jgi:hypothetical protein
MALMMNDIFALRTELLLAVKAQGLMVSVRKGPQDNVFLVQGT